MRHGAFDYLAIGHRREGVGVGPVAGFVVDVNVEFAGFEGLKGDAVVAIELHFHTVEVVLAAVDRQVAPPVVLHALKADAPARVHTADPVRAAVQAGLEGGAGKVAPLPVMRWQHRQFAQAQYQ